ncbi:MAG: sodium:calcium antiporter [Candidatus Nealsonbacteria bacterium DGGOD1a]|nr:MAG: sodium:calcium antiporter [Candidatus Nealsonbacteria bacterium DGGOD1a]
MFFYFLIFLLCCGALYFAGNWVVSGMARLAKLFGLKEFVVAFFIMALAATLPNLFLAIMSVINGVPELSLGDILGGNVVDMTLAIALAAFFSKNGIDTKGGTIQTSLIFTFAAAILPLALLLDNNLSRVDGVLLLALFFAYVYWLLSKKERFKEIYSGHQVSAGKKLKDFRRDIAKVGAGIVGLIIIAQTLIFSAQSFSDQMGISLPVIGILIIGLGNCFPEIYFGIAAAKNGKTKMIMGDLMGAIVISGTFVLGLVAMFSPIEIGHLAKFAAARYFLFSSALFFYICARSGQKITKKEAVMLLAVYIAFLITEIFAK